MRHFYQLKPENREAYHIRPLNVTLPLAAIFTIWYVRERIPQHQMILAGTLTGVQGDIR